MGSRATAFRVAIASALALAGVVLVAPSANASFHLMKISEFFPGTAADADSAFIELQMYAAGQNIVGGRTIDSFVSPGTPLSTFVIPGNVPNGDNQRTILIGDTNVATRDFTYDVLGDVLQPNAGGAAICFEAIDCVSWGTYSGALPSPAGTNAPAIPDGSSLERSIAPNCATLLESADDTNNSLADFSLATPSPRSNATPPTETACAGGGNPGGGPDTKINKGPKKKTKRKRATFEFSSPTPEVSFECSVDGNAPKAFGTCTSPFTVRVKKGKHKFEVRAVLNGTPDGSPADYSWKVKKRKRDR
jgi:hypothetical protein